MAHCIFDETLREGGCPMDKLDFKKADKAFYSGKQGRWDHITLPKLSFLSIEGKGAPEGPVYAAALAALYPLAYGLKFAAKAQGKDFVVPPLEALWWSQKLDAYTQGRRDEWQWQALLRMPDFITQEMLNDIREEATAKLTKKLGASALPPLEKVALTPIKEGPCLQTLHIGSYADEAPVLAKLHDAIMPEQGLTFAGPHHEIYLSDPRKTAPEKLKTILRQPVKPA
jgi:hypothetical protein